MRLFSAIVVDVWHSRRAEATTVREQLAQRLSELRRREATLEEAYLYRQSIDRSTYERQRDLLRESIALATLEAEDAKLDEIDVDGLLGFAEFILSNAARLWSEATFDQRQRLKRVLSLQDSDFRTADLEPL